MKVKVCGITSVEDALLAVELGADLLGLNFWPGSPRAIDVRRARAITEAVGGRALLVGVFVDQGAAWVARTRAEAGLDLVQLHGDEGPAEAAALAPRALKAFRLGDRFDPVLAAPFAGCWGFLLDAARPGHYGGTGEPWSWERAAGVLPGRRLLLAGGIAPGRVRALAERWKASDGAARRGGERPGAAGGPADDGLPWGIDVCSGVERAPGIKDEHKLRELFTEVRDVEIATVA